MMSEVMRLTTFFATLSVTGLFATSIALACAGAMNTSGVPLLCRDCAPMVAHIKKPIEPRFIVRAAVPTAQGI
jgi:hypothetical protein